MTYSGVEARTFNTGGGADALTINDVTVALAATSTLSSLALNANATLDLADYHLVIDYAPGNTPIAALDNLLLSGRNGGNWNGLGIITSEALAKLPSTRATLGIAEASDVVKFAGQQTALWRSQIVDASSVLISYTYVGDATLEGIINGDDYFMIDAHAGDANPGYAQGDFDFNTRVDADDYWLIDANYNKAQTPLAAPVIVDVPPPQAQAFELDGVTFTTPPSQSKDDVSALLDDVLY
jgi:hypothetical protein